MCFESYKRVSHPLCCELYKDEPGNIPVCTSRRGRSITDTRHSLLPSSVAKHLQAWCALTLSIRGMKSDPSSSVCSDPPEPTVWSCDCLSPPLPASPLQDAPTSALQGECFGLPLQSQGRPLTAGWKRARHSSFTEAWSKGGRRPEALQMQHGETLPLLQPPN